MIKTVKIKNKMELARFKKRAASLAEFSAAEQKKVSKIVADVRHRGDKALLAYAAQFDGLKITAADLALGQEAIRAAYAQTSREMVTAMKAARKNIIAFQEKMKRASWRSHLRPGVMLGQLIRPLARVGICVPGGEAPLVSSVLMSAVPAKVAGVKQIVMCTPNRSGRGVDPRLLVAADIAGVDEIYQVGGAQAVAAMAYGTGSLARVDKIVGPGSRWVTMAKKQVYGDVGIDSLAGPSEALVIADESTDPVFIAADVISQAEHAGDETAILVSTSARLMAKVQVEIKKQIISAPRRKMIASSLKKYGLMVLVKDMPAALEVANAVGPEHLQLLVRDAESYLPKIKNAGAIFIGTNSPVALGDFVAGPSHVLPTGGTARFSSGLSMEDFVSKSSIIKYSRQALLNEEKHVAAFAQAEGLQAHGDSVALRRKKR